MLTIRVSFAVGTFNELMQLITLRFIIFYLSHMILEALVYMQRHITFILY